jgi:hypothetical protein
MGVGNHESVSRTRSSSLCTVLKHLVEWLDSGGDGWRQVCMQVWNRHAAAATPALIRVCIPAMLAEKKPISN